MLVAGFFMCTISIFFIWNEFPAVITTHLFTESKFIKERKCDLLVNC